MSAPRAIQGSLVDAKNIAVHKSVRLSIDVPAELGADIIKMFGWPTMAHPVSVAVAMLAEPAQIEAQAESAPATNGNGKRQWRDLSGPQQAGIRCAEPAFQRFLREQGESDVNDTDAAAVYVRLACGVHSRSQISTKRGAAVLWHDLDTRYQAWLAGVE